jgi:hypothetical protein
MYSISSFVNQIICNSKIYGEYYFNDELVTVYSHYSYRLFIIINNDIHNVSNEDFGTTLLTKKEWRNRKINTILK